MQRGNVVVQAEVRVPGSRGIPAPGCVKRFDLEPGEYDVRFEGDGMLTVVKQGITGCLTGDSAACSRLSGVLGSDRVDRTMSLVMWPVPICFGVPAAFDPASLRIKRAKSANCETGVAPRVAWPVCRRQALPYAIKSRRSTARNSPRGSAPCPPEFLRVVEEGLRAALDLD